LRRKQCYTHVSGLCGPDDKFIQICHVCKKIIQSWPFCKSPTMLSLKIDKFIDKQYLHFNSHTIRGFKTKYTCWTRPILTSQVECMRVSSRLITKVSGGKFGNVSLSCNNLSDGGSVKNFNERQIISMSHNIYSRKRSVRIYLKKIIKSRSQSLIPSSKKT